MARVGDFGLIQAPRLAWLAATCAWAMPLAAMAQQGALRAIVQNVPTAEATSLNAALIRLGRNPRDLSALLDAGNAALASGDAEAAAGFFGRADQVSSGNPRVKAGLAGALVRNENPFDAIPLFQEAERSGADIGTLSADRGLAYDLVSDNATAQRYYQQALGRGPNDEVVRRMALSLAIAGDKRGSEAMLMPLLQRQDKAAWRARAFALAILGQEQDAVSIAYATLPHDLAASISPYLRYMPRLTRAQQAAAANFGHFPRASEVGFDDPRVARYTTANPRRPALASADTALVPKGEPLGRSGRSAANASERVRLEQDATAAAQRQTLAVVQPRALPPEPLPTRTVDPVPALAARPPGMPVRIAPPAVVKAPSPKLPPALAVATPPRPVAALSLVVPPTVRAPLVAVVVTPAAARPVLGPSFDLAQIGSTPTPRPSIPPPSALAQTQVAHARPNQTQAGQTQASQGQAAQATSAAVVAASDSSAVTATASVPPTPAPAATPSARRASLSEAFSDFVAPQIDKAPASGAVDVRRLNAARAAAVAKTAAAAKLEKPAPPAHPSRIWVQVATGRDKAALAFDWRRLSRDAARVLTGRVASVSAWGQTNRLLTGPFESTAAANQFIAQLRKEDVPGAFVWTSPAGQVVDALGPGK